MRFLRTLKMRLLRRPLTFLGTACTGAFVGLLIFNRILPNGATSCVAVCTGVTTSAAYTRLELNEASRTLHHPRVRGFDVNFLPSNFPMEDRFVIGESLALNAAAFSVIDGHKGHQCAEHLQRHMLGYLARTLLKGVAMKSTKPDDAWDTVTGMTWSPPPPPPPSLPTGAGQSSVKDALSSLSPSTMEQCIREAFRSLDDDISAAGLAEVKRLRKGSPLTESTENRIMEALSGACAIAAIVQSAKVYVASVGDCRAVLGRKLANGTWAALPLSVDQNADNPAEVKRVTDAHPGEPSAILRKRILGNLMPFRSFGDFDFKWNRKELNGLVALPSNYLTPPYVTAEPVITTHPLQEGDEFVIIASDGLWDKLSNEKAVQTVAKCLEGSGKKSNSWFGGPQEASGCCCLQNAATRLLWTALGGTQESVQELLDVGPPYSRVLRDDITVIVVHLRSSEDQPS